jgi:pilus assembly protein Flp/PilA
MLQAQTLQGRLEMITELRTQLPRLSRDDGTESGQGMIEYGLLVALISIAAIAVIVLLGPQLITIFGSVYNAL